MRKNYRGVIMGLLCVLGVYNTLPAQSLTAAANQNFEQLGYSQASWVDVNNDGYPDVFLTGRDQSGYLKARFYVNQQDGSFVEISTSLPALTGAKLSWSDINGDGYLDVLIMGTSAGGTGVTELWQNNGNLSFTKKQSFTGLKNGGGIVEDFGKNGHREILVWGTDATNKPVTKMYSWQSNQFVEVVHNLPDISMGAMDIIDFNKDGLKDLLISGLDATGSRTTALYLSNGNFSFVNSNISFNKLLNTTLKVADFNADGNQDFIISGLNESNSRVSQLYINSGSVFVKSIFAPVGFTNGSVLVVDMNNDGLQDIVIAGYTSNSTYETRYYQNIGNASFQETSLGVENIGDGSLVAGDFNHDYSLDLLITGRQNGYLPPLTKLYKNNLATANTLPELPQNLLANTAHDLVYLKWDAAKDAQTPVAGLGYQVYVGTTPGKQDVYSSGSDVATGAKRVAGLGTHQQQAGILLKGLPEGKYYWSVQSVDNSYGASNFAVEQSFVICHDIYLGEDKTVCPGDLLSFQFGTTKDVVNWYSIKKGALASNTNQLNFSTEVTDTVVVEVTRPLGCTVYDSLIVKVLEQPSVNLGNDREVCYGEEVTLQVEVGYSKVDWYLKDGTLLLENSTSYTHKVVLDSELVVKVFNELGCTDSDTLAIKARPLPVVNLGEDQSLCVGDMLRLDVGASYASVNWYLKDGSLLLSNNPKLNMKATVDREVVVEVKDAFGCQNYDTLKLTVLSRPLVNLGKDKAICLNDLLTLDAGSGYTSVNWYIKGNSTPIQTNAQVLSYKITQDIELVAEVFNAVGCPNYDTLAVQALERPIVSLGDDQRLCEGEILKLDVGTDYANVNWYLTDGTNLATNSSTYTHKMAGNLNLVVEVFNDLGCSNYDTLSVTSMTLTDVNLGDDQQICLGDMLKLAVNLPGVTVNWYSSDGTKIKEASSSLEQQITADAEVVVEVINAEGCKTYDTLAVTALPLPEISLGADVEICYGESIKLDVGTAYASVTWYLADGTLIKKNSQTLDYKILQSTELVVKVDNNLGCSNFDTLFVQVLDLPQFSLGTDQVVCSGTALDFEVSESFTAARWYTASEGLIAEGFAVRHVFSSSDKIWAEVENANGCVNYDTVEVQVNELPLARAGEDKVFCVGSSVQIGGQYASITGLSFSWMPAELLNDASLPNPTVTTTQTTTFYLTVTNQQGCQQFDTVTVHQDQISVINPGVDRYICLGESTRLGGEPTAQGSLFEYSYAWSPTETLDDPTTANPLASPQATTTYQLITRTGECVVDTAYVIVEVKSLPEVSISEDITVGYGESVTLSAGGGQTYYWYPQTGLDSYTIPNPVASPRKTTEYHVIITDAFGCQNEAKVRVYVKNDVFVPNLFTPNGDGNNDVMKVYGNGMKELTFSIYNRYGKLMYQTSDVEEAMSSGWDGTVNGTPQENGIYMWSIKGIYYDGSLIQFKGNQTGTFKLIR